MNKIEIIEETYPDIKFLTADGFDEAILGVVEIRKINIYVIAYSRSKAIDILMKRDGMTFEIATEFFDFNVQGAYMGEKTPLWIDDEMLNDI